jgi:hypothetical protein
VPLIVYATPSLERRAAKTAKLLFASLASSESKGSLLGAFDRPALTSRLNSLKQTRAFCAGHFLEAFDRDLRFCTPSAGFFILYPSERIADYGADNFPLDAASIAHDLIEKVIRKRGEALLELVHLRGPGFDFDLRRVFSQRRRSKKSAPADTTHGDLSGFAD